MTPDKIKMIAARALSGIDSILAHWLPNGKREGDEYKPLNPKRSDNSIGSFSINTRSGQWADFADDAKGNDLVSLVAYLEGITQSEAAKRVANFLNIRIENDTPERSTRPQNGKGNTMTPAKKIDDGWKCIMPVPDGAPPPPDAHPKHGKPSHRYDYLTGYSARTNFYHDRYNKPAGEKKQFAPLTLWQKGKAFKWFNRGTHPANMNRAILMLFINKQTFVEQREPFNCSSVIGLFAAGFIFVLIGFAGERVGIDQHAVTLEKFGKLFSSPARFNHISSIIARL